MSINQLVQQIYDNTKKVFAGTVYEDDFSFYHDALSLMTSQSCKEYMIKTGFIDHWILPQNNLNSQTKYENRPVGNSPVVMPMDSNLNKDLHEGVNWLCCITNCLDNTDPKKLLKQMLSAYARA